MRLLVGNAQTVLDGCPRWALIELDKLLSYPIKGAVFSMAFRRGRWDGKAHLIRVSKGVGYTFPTGLLPDVRNALHNLGVPFRIVREKTEDPFILPKHKWISGQTPRTYQAKAVDAFLEGRGVAGLGILKMPIRSGKTFTAAILTERVGLCTLFVVPSILLLDQTARVFRGCFGKGLIIGEFGGGKDNLGDITIATYQSLMFWYKARLPRLRDYLQRVGLLIVDECHHLEAEEWRRPLLACQARYRVGLSATAYVSRKKPNEQSAVWLKAVCGPVVYSVDMAYLVRKKWLVKTAVAFHTITSPRDEGTWTKTTYDRLITMNNDRNTYIVDEAEEAKRQGARVLVDIARIKHGKILLAMLRARGLTAALMVHHTPPDARAKILDSLRNGKIDVLVSTLLGEGVDVPELEVVINAEGGASRKSTIQRLRNMTPSEGKTSALIVDFIDLTNPYLAEHSRKRLQAYRKEGCFDVIIRGSSEGSR